MAIKVDYKTLHAEAEKVKGWVTTMEGARSNVDNLPYAAEPLGSSGYGPHMQVKYAIFKTKTYWAEGWRIATQDLILLGQVLDRDRKHLDLTEKQLAELIAQQKPYA